MSGVKVQLSSGLLLFKFVEMEQLESVRLSFLLW